MNSSHDNVLIPSLHDRLTDAGCRGGGFADESPDDGWSAHRADDPAYVADMQRLEAARGIGYVDAACLGCGCLLFVPEGRRCGDVLCNRCEAAGNALAAEEDGNDTDPPPAAAAPVPECDTPEFWRPGARKLGDDQLITAVDLADRAPARLGLLAPGIQVAALAAFTSEVLRRVDASKAA
jgi:hypothetical protein